MSRFLSWSALLLIVVTLVACAAPGPPDLLLARHLGLAGATLATDMVWRQDPDTLRSLGRGWDVDIDSELVEGIWAIGKESELHLFVVQEGAHRLAFEAVPPEGATAQGVTARLNGERLLAAVSMRPGWARYELELPAELLRIGYNRIDLSFSTPLRPSEIDADNSDDRLLAARFRYFRLLPPTARPAPPGIAQGDDFSIAVAPASAAETAAPRPLWRPGVIELAEGPAIVLPADSILEMAVDLPDRARLLGTPVVELDSDASGSIDWTAELLTADGSVHELASGTGTSLFRRGLPASLSGWAGESVSVRIRTWGSAEGHVLWTGLGFQGSVDERQFDPPPLPIPETSGRLGKPDIVVILLDAARADAFSTFRGATATPNVDALAADGTRFETAYTAAPWTGQSIYSIFTGRYPEAHGIAAWKDQLPEEIRSLFQHMYAAGYYTYLWTEHPVYRGTRNLRYDVDTIVDIKPRERFRRRELLPKAHGEDGMLRPGKPSFAFIHLVPPHAPYAAPAPYGGTLSSRFTADLSLDMGDLQAWSFSLGEGAPTPEQIRYAWSAYLENVQYADELVGQIVEELKGAGRYDDAVVVLLSDHGEAFFEHGHFLHTWPMYEELLRVPLVIKWPRANTGHARALQEPVTLIDVAPTLLDGIGVDAEGLGFQGHSLLPVVFDSSPPRREIYAHTVGLALRVRGEEPFKPMSVLVRDGKKVIWDQALGRVELYDLSADPAEENDLAAERPALAQRLLQRLRLQQQANRLVLGGLQIEESQGELDEETIERLRSLGYIR